MRVIRLSLVAAAACVAVAAAGMTGSNAASHAVPDALCAGSGPRGADTAIYRTPVGCVRLSSGVYFNNPHSQKGHRALVVRRRGRTVYWSHLPWRVAFQPAEVECDGGTFRVRYPFVYRSIRWCTAADRAPSSSIGGGTVHGVFRLIARSGRISGVRRVRGTVTQP